jgi:hypothetical protein
MVFNLEGYADDPRSPVAIPEIRAFYSELKDQWPFWFYACNLSQPDLLIMLLCCMKSIRVTKRDGNDMFGISFSIPEMDALICEEMQKMENLCQMLGLSAEVTSRRRQRVLEYIQKNIVPCEG